MPAASQPARAVPRMCRGLPGRRTCRVGCVGRAVRRLYRLRPLYRGVCPTQALALPETLALADPIPGVEAERTLRIDCRKVPESQRAPATLAVSCTGALTPGHLLARHAAGLRVEVVDRGWCEGCEACGIDAMGHPAQAALDEANLWLESIGASPGPALVQDGLPIAQRPDSIPPVPDAPERSSIAGRFSAR